jgi:pimeloyl-ACP methyl ester carboxylesterase
MARVPVPVVAVRGHSSVFLDDTRWEGLLRGAPHAVRHQLPDHGHLLPLEAPEATAHTVLDTLPTARPR